jgi:hypothetical protein
LAPAVHAAFPCAALPLAAGVVAAAGAEVCAGGSAEDEEDDDDPHAATTHAVAIAKTEKTRTARV